MPTDNPFSQFSEGINTGAQWAHQAATLDLQRQQLERQKEQLAESKRQFNVQTGAQFYDKIKDIVTEPGSRVKAAKIKGLQQYAATSGIPIDQSWLSSFEDETYKLDYGKLFDLVERKLPKEERETFLSG